MLKEDVRMFKFVRIALYIKKEIWMSVRLNKLMKESLQAVFEKADGRESIIAAKKEVKKEIGLAIIQL